MDRDKKRLMKLLNAVVKSHKDDTRALSASIYRHAEKLKLLLEAEEG